MEKGNVLVIGNSGVGKSTLINAVLGEYRAPAEWRPNGKTKKLEIYENDNVPFRLVDSVGFEPSYFKAQASVNSIIKWCKDGINDAKEEKQINAIWFCIEATTPRLFPETIKNLSRATRIFKSVPVIVVLTKSYSLPERERNIENINKAFAATRHAVNLTDIVPVVAQEFVIDDNAYSPVDGISDLIDKTNNLLPEGIKLAQKDIAEYILERKRFFSQGIVGLATVAATTVGAVPIPFPDAAILGPTELAEVNAITSIYGIGKDAKGKKFVNSIIDIGTVGVVAKTAINAIKAIPGVNIAGSLLNAVVAGSIVATLGEGTVYISEQIFLGNKTLDDVDWIKKIFESEFSNKTLDYIKIIENGLKENTDIKEIGKSISEMAKAKLSKKQDPISCSSDLSGI